MYSNPPVLNIIKKRSLKTLLLKLLLVGSTHVLSESENNAKDPFHADFGVLIRHVIDNFYQITKELLWKRFLTL